MKYTFADPAALWRLLRLAAACLAIAILMHKGFAAPTRLATVFALAAIVAVALVYELAVRGVAPQFLLLAALLVFGAGWAGYALLQMLAPPVHYDGPLLAGDAPAPPSACGDPGKNLRVIFGGDGVIAQGRGPFVPFHAGTCPAMTLTRTPRGLQVNAYGYDSGGDVVYRIVDNRFTLVLRGYLSEERPDAATLRVADENGVEAFSIRYLNPGTVVVRGTFRCGDTKPVTIGDTTITSDGRSLARHACAMIDTLSSRSGGFSYAQ